MSLIHQIKMQHLMDTDIFLNSFLLEKQRNLLKTDISTFISIFSLTISQRLGFVLVLWAVVFVYLKMLVSSTVIVKAQITPSANAFACPHITH